MKPKFKDSHATPGGPAIKSRVEDSAAVIAAATHFTAVAHVGGAKYDKREFGSLGEARAEAARMYAGVKPIMVYAYNETRQVMAGTFGKNGWEDAA